MTVNDAAPVMAVAQSNQGSWGEPNAALVRAVRVFNADPIGTTDTLNSLGPGGATGVCIASFRYYGLWIKCASSGTVSVQVQFTQSWDDVAADYVAPAENIPVATVADTSAHVFVLRPSPMPWLRVQLIGTGSNDASTTATAYLWAQS